MNEAMIKLVELLEKAGAAITESAKEGLAYTFPLMVRERFIAGVFQSIFAFIALASVVVLVYLGIKSIHRNESADGEILLVISAFPLIVFIGLVSFAVENLFSPEMAAIEKLLSLISRF